MKPIDDDTLQAYVDGELDAEGSAQIDAALAQDELLASRAQQARALRAQLQDLFNPVLDEPVPARLSALLRSASPQAPMTATPPVAASARRGFGAGRRRPSSRRWLVSGGAVAASIAVLAVALWWHTGSGLVRTRDGQRFAAGPLAHALDQALASEPDPHAAVAIGLSFRSTDGRICRTFVARGTPALAGLACHARAGWSLPALSAADTSPGGELRQAASDLPPAVRTAVDARIRGEAFDARQERAARDDGWR